jgi:UrcA family protein
MSDFTTKLVAAGYLVLASVPVAGAMASIAHAQPAPVTVKIGDLDLGSTAGQKQFTDRVHAAGRAFCGDEASLQERDACMAGVRLEAHEKLAQVMAARAARTTAFAAR